MSQTKTKHYEPLVAVWLRPSTTGPCICCKQVAEKPRGERLKMMYVLACAAAGLFVSNSGFNPICVLVHNILFQIPPSCIDIYL